MIVGDEQTMNHGFAVGIGDDGGSDASARSTDVHAGDGVEYAEQLGPVDDELARIDPGRVQGAVLVGNWAFE